MLLPLTWAVFPLLASASILQQRDIEPAEASLANLTLKLTFLDGNVTNFPNVGGSVLQALIIHTILQDLIATTHKAIDDILGCVATFGPADQSDAAEFISLATRNGGYVEKTVDSMKQMTIKKSAFAALPIDFKTTFSRDLVDYNTNSNGYLNSLISGTPAVLVAQANTIKGQITAAFSGALSAYGAG